MKTKQQIQERIDSLNISLKRLNKELEDTEHYPSQVEIQIEIDELQAQIELLEWVLKEE